MIATSPIPVVASPLGQRSVLSRLSERELQEVHATPTHYPRQNSSALNSKSVADCRSEKPSKKRAKAPGTDSSNDTKTSLKEGMPTVFSHLYQSYDDKESVVPITTRGTQLSSESDALISSKRALSSVDDTMSVEIDCDEKIDERVSSDQDVQGSGGAILAASDSRGEVAVAHNAGDDIDSNGIQPEHAHEKIDILGKSEGENATAVSSFMMHPALAPAAGSSGSSDSELSGATAAALRVTHLLNELTAAVSRLRLDSGDGKELTIQLRRDVLAETEIHIVSTTKQMEVSFATRSATSNLILNTHLVTLQNHLNDLCPGQVVNIQTQFISSASSSRSGTEQDRAYDEQASLDQGNRRNLGNDDDDL